jgi:hypothetical protein
MTCAAVALLAPRRCPDAHLYGFGTGRTACRAISVPSIAALVVVVPLDRLQPSSTKTATSMERWNYCCDSVRARPLEARPSNLDRPPGDCRRRGLLLKPDEPASLDGRYFGPIPSAAIVGQAEPISTFAKLLGRHSGASSERELFRPAAISSPSFRPTLCALQAARFSSDSLARSIEPHRELSAPKILLAAPTAPA